MMDKAHKIINAGFPLETRDAGEYASFKASPLSAGVDRYYAEGLGNVAFLHGRAMGGLMKLEALIIDPFERDVPLFSFDYISAMGKHTVLTEYYDTLLDAEAFDTAPLERAKESIDNIPDNDLKEHWYDSLKLAPSFSKKVGRKELAALETAFVSALEAYIIIADKMPPLDEIKREEKRLKAEKYVNGLITNGGPSTDAFTKAIGKERTEDLFKRIVFGTKN